MCVNPQWIVPFFDSKKLRYSYRFSKVPQLGVCIDEETGEVYEQFQVGCGKCLECINLHKLQWTHRLLDELSCHQQSCFLTLTYGNSKDFDNDLHPKHTQLFIKRLRRCIEPIRIRYYLCGEYGSRGRRPHYHVVVFGYDFQDKIPFRRDRSGYLMSRSDFLERIWDYGFSSILPVNSATLGYVTKDMQKLLPLNDNRHPPFTRQSNRPGIGANGWNRSLTDGKLWHNSRNCPLPRYYKKLAEREGLDLRSLLIDQILFAKNRELVVDFEQREKICKEKLDKLMS